MVTVADHSLPMVTVNGHWKALSKELRVERLKTDIGPVFTAGFDRGAGVGTFGTFGTIFPV
jgi:hypothetical protein